MIFSDLLPLFFTMLILSAVPGPSDFAIVARTLGSNFAQAIAFTIGILLADFLFIIIALFSLDFLAATFQPLFVITKITCAGFLLWLGVVELRGKTAPPKAGRVRRSSINTFSSVTAGFFITLSDPKAILFYMGLFPAFIETGDIGLSTAFVVLLVATLAIGLVKLSYAALADRARRFFSSDTAQTWVHATAGIVLIIIALLVILTTLRPVV